MKISRTMSNMESVNQSNTRIRKAVYNVRVGPYLELFGIWKTEMTKAEDPTISFKNHDVQEGRRRHLPIVSKSAFPIMEAFFAIKTPEDAGSFFEANGPMQLTLQGGQKLRRKAAPVRFSQVIARRDFWLAASRGEIGRVQEASNEADIRAFFEGLYVSQPLQAELDFVPCVIDDPQGRVPVVSIRCLDVEEVLRASVFLDRHNGLKWGLCAFEKCGKPFRIGGHKDKVYCGPICAGRQSSRNYLANHPEALLKRKSGLK